MRIHTLQATSTVIMKLHLLHIVVELQMIEGFWWGLQGMQTAAQVTELEVPLQCRVAWLRKNYSYFEDEHRELLMGKLDALTKTSGKKVCRCGLATTLPLHEQVI